MPGAISKIPLEYVDDTLGFNPEWVVDKIAPRPVLFITTEYRRGMIRSTSGVESPTSSS